jgi:Flp pilus assembly protein TadG
VTRLARRSDGRAGQRGQAIIEFGVIVPVFTMLLLGLLEFGMLFTHHITLEYATREGARTAASLGNGDGDAATCATIDPQIVAAVQRVLESHGSPIALSAISEISIFRADLDGGPIAGSVNTWTYTGAQSGPTVEGQKLAFTQQTQAWMPCSRVTSPTAQSIGVSLQYHYKLLTPLSALGAAAGSQGVPMSDATIMALNP